MSGNVLMDLGVLADEVIGPLLCNPENQRGWPKIVQHDMAKHVNDLRNLMHQVLIGSYLSRFILQLTTRITSIVVLFLEFST